MTRRESRNSSLPAPNRGQTRVCDEAAAPAGTAGRSPLGPGESNLMASSHADVEQFERYLLKRGVNSLTADRDRCVDCSRTPLVGERVHLYQRLSGIVCELCRPLRRGEPAATEVVRHSELGHTVRLTARAA
jgi:hypothetical protein